MCAGGHLSFTTSFMILGVFQLFKSPDCFDNCLDILDPLDDFESLDNLDSLESLESLDCSVSQVIARGLVYLKITKLKKDYFPPEKPACDYLMRLRIMDNSLNT